MEPERIVLVGAGDHSRGVLEILRRISASGTAVEVIGFADDDPGVTAVDGIPLLGTTDWLRENLDRLHASLLLSLASPAAKKKLAAKLGQGARWARAVHPRADLAPSVVVGAGSVVTRPVPSNVTAAGVPAKAIKERPPGWHDG